MPYTPPSSSRKANEFEWAFLTKKKDDVNELEDNLKNREDALKEVKDILSTSPQLSTSPRRRSAPDSYSRKPTLTVALPLPEEIPCLLRKKSGEIVKSSLKKGLSKSEPPTPTTQFPKYVHFNADLEQIRLFNEAQRPQAVSADESSESDDDEFEFNISDDDDDEPDFEEPELIISLPNKPTITTMHRSKPVYVESIFLSQDKRKLQGRIMVQNIAFQKTVEVRYTFDFWSTVSQVPASFAEGVPSKDNKNNFDVFMFSIELIDNSRNPIDGKTMYFAIHYSVDDNDFWDNNNGSNYQVNFKRMTPPSTPKKKPNTSFQNTPSRWSMTSTIPRQSNKDLDERSPESSPRFTSSNSIDMRKRLMGRYDISDSLFAAQNSQKLSIPRANSTSNDVTRTFQTIFTPQLPYGNYGNYGSYGNENFHAFFPNNYVDGMPGTTDFPVSHSSGFEPLKPSSNPITIPSSKPPIGSSSYYEIINQYCFYGSTGSPPVMTSSVS